MGAKLYRGPFGYFGRRPEQNLPLLLPFPDVNAKLGRMNSFTWLAVAIVAEVIATSALKTSENFSRLGPSLICAAGYGLSFYSLSFALRTIPTGVAYAIWSGVGMVLISAVGWFWFKQRLDTPALIGMGLILVGVAVLNLYSKSLSH